MFPDHFRAGSVLEDIETQTVLVDFTHSDFPRVTSPPQLSPQLSLEAIFGRVLSDLPKQDTGHLFNEQEHVLVHGLLPPRGFC